VSRNRRRWYRLATLMNSRTQWILGAIVLAYAAIAVLYAVLTPVWQVPDEPAHYNYVRALAQGNGLPVLEVGDYDQDYLSQLTTERFPPDLPIDSVEYEDHQPPLYYAVATPLYLASGGAVVPLRLLSVVFGAGVLVAAFSTVKTVFPDRSDWALATAAFIAFVPQHIAITAGVENDALAELVVGCILWALVKYVQGADGRPWRVGVLLGVALLTKGTAYVSVGVAVIGAAARWRREKRSAGWLLSQVAWMLIPALLLAGPWLIRNGLVYGWDDLTAQQRHEAVVAGQPRSVDWLADYGWTGLLLRLVRTTFQSFWGQFGWMGVLLPATVYQVLALLSVALVAGFGWWLFDKRRAALVSWQVSSMFVLASSCAGTVLVFLWYNLSFVQHQGRYLFPALIFLGMTAGIGATQWTRLLPKAVRPWALTGLLVCLAVFDLVCLFRYIIPALVV
jgi:4-amino-4-deoxy-L-arabinose transferase-like glycosyltransferase